MLLAGRRRGAEQGPSQNAATSTATATAAGVSGRERGYPEVKMEERMKKLPSRFALHSLGRREDNQRGRGIRKGNRAADRSLAVVSISAPIWALAAAAAIVVVVVVAATAAAFVHEPSE